VNNNPFHSFLPLKKKKKKHLPTNKHDDSTISTDPLLLTTDITPPFTAPLTDELITYV
jgi:hypothetical protein